jgi:hypothetical protein
MARITRQRIADEDRHMLKRQAEFRVAADAMTAALAAFPEVAAVALIGSVAQPLRRERSPYSPFRRQGIAILHQCDDIDLAVWLDRLDGLHALNKTRSRTTQRLFAERGIGVAHHQVEIFIFRAGSNDYLGRLCTFGTCPKGKRACMVPGCGDMPFLQQHEDFVLWPATLQEDRMIRLYDRDTGILQRAADRPPSEMMPEEAGATR